MSIAYAMAACPILKDQQTLLRRGPKSENDRCSRKSPFFGWSTASSRPTTTELLAAVIADLTSFNLDKPKTFSKGYQSFVSPGQGRLAAARADSETGRRLVLISIVSQAEVPNVPASTAANPCTANLKGLWS
jgi:hypothetical protein